MTARGLERLLAGAIVMGVALAFVGCESGSPYEGNWAIHLTHMVGRGSAPGPAEWDTTLVLAGDEGNLAGHLAGHEGSTLSQESARRVYGDSTDYQLHGVISGNIEVLIWNLSVSGPTISGRMRWGAGSYGGWRTWRFSGNRE